MTKNEAASVAQGLDREAVFAAMYARDPYWDAQDRSSAAAVRLALDVLAQAASVAQLTDEQLLELLAQADRETQGSEDSKAFYVLYARKVLAQAAPPAGSSKSGWEDADTIIGRLMSADPDFDDCADAAAFIRRMYDEHMRGPDGYATWKDAAIAERKKRLAGRVEDRVPYLPYLTDRADGVKGHYCITRWVPERRVVEHWNLRRHHWAAFSDDVLTMEQAVDLMKQLEIPTARRILAAPSQSGGVGERGWADSVVVPRKPTNDMCAAGLREQESSNGVFHIYQRMIEAAPPAAPVQGDVLTPERIMHIVRYSTVGSKAIPESEWVAFARALLAATAPGESGAEPVEELPQHANDDRAVFPASAVRLLWELKEHYRNLCRPQPTTPPAAKSEAAPPAAPVQAHDPVADRIINWLRRNANAERASTDARGAFIEAHNAAVAIRREAASQPGEMGAGVPDGWKLVPIEPTDDMLRAIRRQRSGGRVGAAGDRADWAAWLSAAPAASAQQDEHCQCPACAKGTIHDSDCAAHNAPAYPNGPCDCGGSARQDEREAFEVWFQKTYPTGKLQRAGGHDESYAYPATQGAWHGWCARAAQQAQADAVAVDQRRRIYVGFDNKSFEQRMFAMRETAERNCVGPIDVYEKVDAAMSREQSQGPDRTATEGSKNGGNGNV